MMLRLLRALDRSPQWLAAWTLIAFVAMAASGHVLRGVSAPLSEKTGFKLVDLGLAGWHPILTRVRTPHGSLNDLLGAVGLETHAAADIIRAWSEARVLDAARRAQQIDFFFPVTYGAFGLLLAVGLWR